MKGKLRRDNHQISALTVEEVNRALSKLGERMSQTDAVGQNPDMKGRTVKNMGNVKSVELLPDTGNAADAVAAKLNEVIRSLR